MKKYFLAFDSLNNSELFNVNVDGDADEQKEPQLVELLSITSALLESYWDVLEITEPSSDDGAAVKLKLDALLGADCETSPAFIEEIKTIRFAIVHWIDKGYVDHVNQAGETITDLQDEDVRSIAYLQKAFLKAPLVPQLFIGKGVRSHEADELTTLAWCEIFFAMEQKVKARMCRYCGQVFVLPHNNLSKKTCLRPSCKMKYEIDRHGGPEAFREWNRNRKKAKAKRPPGRPRKQ